MKKIILFALLAFSMSAKAQITLEHVYDSASTSGDSPNFRQSQLIYINLEVSGGRYININRTGKYISVYRLNHTLEKTISFTSFPMPPNQYPTILYFSQNLFDTDSLIEFMYIYNNSVPIASTKIYKEDGTCIFTADSLTPLVVVNIPQTQVPIFNTASGTKMILSHYNNGKAYLYNLNGTLTTEIAEANNNLISIQNSSVSNAYPNPTNNTTQIDYTLPNNINVGEIVFYDLQGNEVKRFKVDKTFNTLLVSTSDIAAGTYYYQLQTTGQNSDGKKLIVIK